MLKDYYKILGVPPNAGPGEIKKSFRQLAMLYHPDKHEENDPSMARFMEIHEAYDTLMDPDKKEIYLQQRWYEQSIGRQLGGPEPLTAETILQEAVRLNRYVSQLNPYRMDRDGLVEYQLKLFSSENIDILKKFNDKNLSAEIVRLSLDSGKHYELSQAIKLAPFLQQLVPDGSDAYAAVEKFIAVRSQQEFWQKWRIPIVLLVTVVICYLIFKAAN